MPKTNQKNIKQQIEANKLSLSALLNNPRNFNKDTYFKFIQRGLLSENAILGININNTNFSKNFDEYFKQCTNNVKNAWEFLYKNVNQSIDFYNVSKLHAILIDNTDINPSLRRYDVRILENDSPNPQCVMNILNNILFNLKKNEQLPPITRAFNLHFDIIKTQPFEDCNKRLARLLMNWVLMKYGYTPILFNCKNDKYDYIQALRDMDKGKSKAYSQYMYGCVLNSQKQLLTILKPNKCH